MSFREISHTVDIITSALHDICLKNINYEDISTNPKYIRTSFHSQQVPSMNIIDYGNRIYRYSRCSDECFVIALILISRYLVRHSDNIILTNLNVHRLFITAIMISAKMRDDIFYSNSYYDQVGGLLPTEINNLERQFLKDIDWNIFVEKEEYDLIIHICEKKLYYFKLRYDIYILKKSTQNSEFDTEIETKYHFLAIQHLINSVKIKKKHI